jgi:hypothetical protein
MSEGHQRNNEPEKLPVAEGGTQQKTREIVSEARRLIIRTGWVAPVIPTLRSKPLFGQGAKPAVPAGCLPPTFRMAIPGFAEAIPLNSARGRLQRRPD